MATYVSSSIQQSTGETRKWVFDYTDDLMSGVTVASGTAVHTPPSGSAASVSIETTNTTVTVQIGPLTVTGVHYLTTTATYSNGEDSEIRLTFNVVWPSTAARVGMSDLISDLRMMTDAGPNDFTVAGVPYWSDAQLQRILDRRRKDFYRAAASPQIEYTGGGTTTYLNYYLPDITNIEQTTGGTSIFELEDADGDSIGTANYSMDYQRGAITFTSSQGGTVYYATGRTYDLNAAAAVVWRQKAANAAKYFDFSTDNHSVKKSQFMKHCIEQAQIYESYAAPRVISVYREDCG